MTDQELDLIKDFFSKFKDYNDLKENHLKNRYPHNEDAIIQLYEQTKLSGAAWDYAKVLRSSESLKIYKELGDNPAIDDIVNKVKEKDLSKYKRVIIILDNKNYDDIDKLKDLGLEVCIRVVGDESYCSIDEFKKMREFFNGFKEQYNPDSLSELEKITLAYDHTKFFAYNEEEVDWKTLSRSIPKSIETGNIVCLGYSRIFCQLLAEMDIKANIMYIEGNERNANGHARVILYVEDNKYNISDTYIFDPTWDSDMKTELVRHSDGTTGYVNMFDKKKDDTVIEKMPSAIRYCLYMIPIYEFSQYFPKETIEKIGMYPTPEFINLEEIKEGFSLNKGKPISTDMLNILPNVLRVTKKIEGYKPDEIEHYIDNAIEIMKQGRFKNLYKNSSLI